MLWRPGLNLVKRLPLRQYQAPPSPLTTLSSSSTSEVAHGLMPDQGPALCNPLSADDATVPAEEAKTHPQELAQDNEENFEPRMPASGSHTTAARGTFEVPLDPDKLRAVDAAVAQLTPAENDLLCNERVTNWFGYAY
ncbi:hypothetical protein K474DRAFT_1712459 [Panus rudis PR-1116 ss-1]|nr:hypothetical protein K474DRAFT_1712459 [Panus rudis PR-1116 ss-1]